MMSLALAVFETVFKGVRTNYELSCYIFNLLTAHFYVENSIARASTKKVIFRFFLLILRPSNATIALCKLLNDVLCVGLHAAIYFTTICATNQKFAKTPIHA